MVNKGHVAAIPAHQTQDIHVVRKTDRIDRDIHVHVGLCLPIGIDPELFGPDLVPQGPDLLEKTRLPFPIDLHVVDDRPEDVPSVEALEDPLVVDSDPQLDRGLENVGRIHKNGHPLAAV
jgi:hypothetical protein